MAHGIYLFKEALLKPVHPLLKRKDDCLGINPCKATATASLNRTTEIHSSQLCNAFSLHKVPNSLIHLIICSASSSTPFSNKSTVSILGLSQKPTKEVSLEQNQDVRNIKERRKT
jgi:hypothetical protein